MTSDTGGSQRLRTRLRSLGLTNAALQAAWPRWWSDEANESPSARVELAFSVARRLGLDPRSLLDDSNEPQFVWQEEARFKHLSGESDLERAGISSFGRAVAATLLEATPRSTVSIAGADARSVRAELMRTGVPYIELGDLLALGWGAGIPIVDLRIFPWQRKRMAAMTARVRDRWAVLVGRESVYPAPVAFYIAHEFGHIALGHVPPDELMVDFDDAAEPADADTEEQAADAWALELLTGDSRPRVLSETGSRPPARELARVASAAAVELAIEPGILAQCYGFSTGQWGTANGALKHIYGRGSQVWATINEVARRELQLDELSPDARHFVGSVLEWSPALE
jgi:hypothetical protein